MPVMRKKIILCPNTGRDHGFEISRQVAEICKSHDRYFAFCPIYDDDTDVKIPDWAKPMCLEDEMLSAEMIITFGGDGTILRAARAAAGFGVPILGVNMGGKGFMAELETNELELINRAVTGDYHVDSRMMLDVEITRQNEAVSFDFALNDVVISGVNKVVDIMMFGDGHRIMHFTGDGVVIATPTGSTAYSMSAGGPIVEPSAHNIIITPICAHVLEAKPFVLVSDRRVCVELGCKKLNPAYMSVDGCAVVEIFGGDIINVRKSDKYTRLVQLSGKSFYNRVSEKLGSV